MHEFTPQKITIIMRIIKQRVVGNKMWFSCI